MTELFWELMRAPFVLFQEDWLGKVVGILMLAVYAVILLLIYGGIVWLIDNISQPIQFSYGKITSKEFRPAYKTTTYVNTGKISIPVTTNHPDSWSVSVQIQGQTASIPVEKDLYESVKENDQIYAGYVIGRFSGSLYLKSVRK